MLKKDFIRQEKAYLTSERRKTLAELAHLRGAVQTEVDADPDEGDVEILEHEKNTVLIALLERKLQDMDAALRAIEKGHYGICERCNNPIEIGRLQAKPDATLCLQCQREVERMARHSHGLQRSDFVPA